MKCARMHGCQGAGLVDSASKATRFQMEEATEHSLGGLHMKDIRHIALPSPLPVAAVLIAALSTAPILAQEPRGGQAETTTYELYPSDYGNPEGIAYDKRSGAFFVGTTGVGAPSGGAIYRGTLDDPTATLFVPGTPGGEATGMKVFEDSLYVAGGFSGTVNVYNIETGALEISCQGFGAGMLNDLIVTQKGDIYVTDSFLPVVWHFTAAQLQQGDCSPDPIYLDPNVLEWDYNTFNLNGIVAVKGGRSLIVVNSNTGKLFRVDLATRTSPVEIHPITVHGQSMPAEGTELLFGDGLLLDKGQLVVVTFAPTYTLTFVRLHKGFEHGTIVERRTDQSLRGPSTVARAQNVYLIVNADFETSTTPFTVTGLPRNAHDEDIDEH